MEESFQKKVIFVMKENFKMASKNGKEITNSHSRRLNVKNVLLFCLLLNFSVEKMFEFKFRKNATMMLNK